MNRKRHTKKINLKKYVNENKFKDEDARSYYNAMRWYFGIFETMAEYKPFHKFSVYIETLAELIDDMQGKMIHDWYTNVDINLIDKYKEVKTMLKYVKDFVNEMPPDGNNKADSLEIINEFVS